MSPQALSYSKKRISSLYDVNKYRRYRILEIMQYTILRPYLHLCQRISSVDHANCNSI